VLSELTFKLIKSSNNLFINKHEKQMDFGEFAGGDDFVPHGSNIAHPQ
jgi:hypothetical protein